MPEISARWLGLELGARLAGIPRATVQAVESIQAPQLQVSFIDDDGLLDPADGLGALCGVPWRGEWLTVAIDGRTVCEGQVVDAVHQAGALALTLQGALAEKWEAELDATVIAVDPATAALAILQAAGVSEDRIDRSGFDRAAAWYQAAGVVVSVYAAAEYHVKLAAALGALAQIGAARIWTDGRVHWWLPVPPAARTVSRVLAVHDIQSIPVATGTGLESVYNDYSITETGSTIPATDATGAGRGAALRGSQPVRCFSADYGAGAQVQLVDGAHELGRLRVESSFRPRQRLQFLASPDLPLEIGEPVRVAWGSSSAVVWVPVALEPDLGVVKVTLEEVLCG